MYPGRLAEHLVVSELTAQPGLIPALFRGLDGPSAREALTVLGRAALSDPAAAPLLAAVLAADLEQLAIPALWVAVETNPGLDRLIAEAIATQPIPVQALNRIAAALPGHSLALAATASAVLRRLARVSRDHAGSLEPSRRVAADP